MSKPKVGINIQIINKERLAVSQEDIQVLINDLTKEHGDTRKKVEALDDFEAIHNYFKPPDPPSKSPGESKDNSGGSGGEG